MITNFHLSADCKTVFWNNDDQLVHLAFEHKVEGYLIEYLNQVLLLADVWEYGKRVLTIYNADGSVRAQPGLPKLKHEVGGIYSIWFVQGKRQQTVVLFTEEFSPYETACNFDLETYQFSGFHPTK